MTSVNETVREHLKASKRFLKSIRGDAKKARAFLVRAGILNKSGKGLSKRYR